MKPMGRLKGKWFWLALFFLLFGLMFFQYKTTRPTDFRRLTEMEKIAQLRRMNEYPPRAYRLANWIEARPEAIIYFKLEKNFIDSFDLLVLFAKYLPALFLPLFLLGYFEAVKSWPRPVLALTILPISLTTLIGHDNAKGPISLLAVIVLASAFGLWLLIRRVRPK